MVCVGVGSTLTAGAAVAASAAVALAVQAASAAADAALDAVAGAGERLAAEGEEQFAAEVVNRRWHMAAAEAVGMNAAIRMLAVRARTVGVPLDLPAPVALDGRSLDAVTAWLVRAIPQVRRAREELTHATVSAHRERLMAGLPVTVDRSSVGEALRRYQETLVQRAAGTVPPVPVDLSWVDAEVHETLAGLDPDAAGADRDRALALAAEATRQADEADAGMYVEALHRLIGKEINARAVAGRRAARWLEALEERVVADAVAADPTGPATGVAKELMDVVAGSAELTPDLSRRARAAVRWAADLTRVGYRADLLRTLLEQRGYQVEPVGPGRLSAARADWGDEHTATVWLNPDGGVHHLLVAAVAASGDVESAREASRDAELGADVADAVHDMTHDGVHGLVVHGHDVQHGHGADDAGRQQAGPGRPAPRARRLEHP